MKKITLIFLFNFNLVFANCSISTNFYTSTEKYISSCKMRQFDPSKDGTEISLCQAYMLQMSQSAQALALDLPTTADISCPIDPMSEVSKVIRYKTNLDFNTQYGLQNPCNYKYPISQPPSAPTTFSEYMDIMYYGFCGI